MRKERPRSPHLTIYRWQIQMVSSILNRVTGLILSLGAFAAPVLLLALASGQEEWAAMQSLLTSRAGRIAGLLLVWSFAYHLINGVRHLAQDFAWGCSVPAFIRNSWISVVGSTLITAALFW